MVNGSLLYIAQAYVQAHIPCTVFASMSHLGPCDLPGSDGIQDPDSMNRDPWIDRSGDLTPRIWTPGMPDPGPWTGMSTLWPYGEQRALRYLMYVCAYGRHCTYYGERC